MPRLRRLSRPIVDCEIYTNEPCLLDITSEYTRNPQDGLETIFTGFGSTIKNFVNRHRRRRNKVLSVTAQVTLSRVTIRTVINLPPPVPGRGKHTRQFAYIISADGKEYPLKLWVKTSRGQFLDGEDGPRPQEPSIEEYYRASLHYARWMIKMCQTVRYVYPDCGHPIRPDSDTVYIERCRIAHDTDSNCWIPQNLPPAFIQDRAYYGEDLAEECATCLSLNAWDDEDAVQAWVEGGSFFERDKSDGEDEEDATEQNATQRETEAVLSEEERLEAEALQWAINKMIEIDSDAEEQSSSSETMDLDGSQPSNAEYR
ncbi:hypothetical protein CDV31_013590 [Fusarium ambrosium]|uniref:Uncharacterized protein n=1 Tax=Fusarium ambrosium TaxID=131363 RepID=A0A428T276_9HYPO|nr:hypothetical protein CDV31_013590 [Fusarium ambrosium]